MREMTTTVIDLHGKRNTHQQLIYTDQIVYCGRAVYMGGWNLKGSIFANPFKGEDAVFNYYLYIMGKIPRPRNAPMYCGSPDEIMVRIGELKGKVLACWCKNDDGDRCHCDVLVFLADGTVSRALKESVDEGLMKHPEYCL